MKTLWAAAIALAGATPASAAIYTYEYQGQPVLCGGPERPDLWGACNMPDSPEGWSGSIAIDEAKLPGGSLADAYLRIDAAEWDNSRVSGYRVERDGRVYTGRGLDGLAVWAS